MNPLPLQWFQKDAVAAAVRQVKNGGRATVVAATGSGKTLIAAGCARRLAARGVVLVPTIELLEQTAEAWSLRGGRREPHRRVLPLPPPHPHGRAARRGALVPPGRPPRRRRTGPGAARDAGPARLPAPGGADGPATARSRLPPKPGPRPCARPSTACPAPTARCAGPSACRPATSPTSSRNSPPTDPPGLPHRPRGPSPEPIPGDSLCSLTTPQSSPWPPRPPATWPP
ncbi:DEAD/DEAH box helicase family protein [Kitasatospora aureofaciens]|uniref:DEAD/DEAH box helicase n=1 Tax=Kitasatospora aureofaciens TaxID=1894 RepID=UPI0035206412